MGREGGGEGEGVAAAGAQQPPYVATSNVSDGMGLYALFGKVFLAAPPPEEHRRPLLNEVWKHVTKVPNP